MKCSLLALGVMAVLMSGCTQKGTITLYAPEEKIVDQFSTIIFTSGDNSIKECKDGESVVSKFELKNTISMPVGIVNETNSKTNESNTTIEWGDLHSGEETSLKACFIDGTKDIQLFFTKKVISIKPLGTFEDPNISCHEVEINYNDKFVTCKSK